MITLLGRNETTETTEMNLQTLFTHLETSITSVLKSQAELESEIRQYIHGKTFILKLTL